MEAVLHFVVDEARWSGDMKGGGRRDKVEEEEINGKEKDEIGCRRAVDDEGRGGEGGGGWTDTWRGK